MSGGNSEFVFQVTGLNKFFGPTHANKNIDFTLKRGEVRGLAGENGSGKSTLLSQLAGIYAPDSGTILKDGAPYAPESPLYAIRSGVSIVVQELGLIGTLPAGVNVFLGRTKPFSKFGVVNLRKVYHEANQILEKWGLPAIPIRRVAGEMNVETKKIVELARALSSEPDVLILDEVTQALSQDNRLKLHKLVEQYRALGRSIILITHDLEEMLEITDSISILRDGELLDTVDSKAITVEELKSRMVGRSLEGEYYRSDAETSHGEQVILSVEHLTTESGLTDVSFKVHEGEIVALCGLSDSGIHEVGKAVYGLSRALKGGVHLVKDGAEIRHHSQAWEHRVGYVPKDRDNEALMLNASIRENFCMSNIPELQGKALLLKNRDLDAAAEGARERFQVKCTGTHQVINALSGGNKQKINLGRWLIKDLQLLIVDCPTRGVDVGVKAYLYQCLKEAKTKGMAILMITDELPEAIGMADNILVMKNGSVSRTISRSSGFSEESIVQVMI
ncbi:MAG: sugar ABC transporter ATP-binding protein [Clostridia bacterium]|nr:sugar ABC transporter ATP-binding protein [Clostridia bacterium]